MTSLAETARDEMVQYWDSGFLAAEANPGAFYDLNVLPAITQASHYRRMALLEGLPLGDLTDKVCVDYGVGSWGFACIFPRLQNCREAIGIDLSAEAVRLSEDVSRRGTFPYGDRCRYFTSTGSALALDDESVDVFFAGESIEHVFNVDAFLDEVSRVLRPGGTFILTTPNADATLYRAHGERYCHNAEHVSLMAYKELRALVDTRFDVTVAKGFNGSFYRTLDKAATDRTFVDSWVAAFEDRPEEATGVILMAVKKPGSRARTTVERVFRHDSPQVVRNGAWATCTLHGPITAARADDPASTLECEWEGDGVVLILWADPWGGHASVTIDGATTAVDTFSPVGGFIQRRWLELRPGYHRLTLAPTPGRHPRSRGNNLIFWRAIGLTRRQRD
jgi:SAM-dependent methyltransferase